MIFEVVAIVWMLVTALLLLGIGRTLTDIRIELQELRRRMAPRDDRAGP